MLAALDADSLAALVERAIPAGLRAPGGLPERAGRSEAEVLAELADWAQANRVTRSYLGMGYHDCLTPPVIQRNILENPGWYTAYTPYQPEIAQGRLEALLNFQTMVSDLTGMEVANASMLDEATAAAEAMTLCRRVLEREGHGRHVFLVSSGCHPQTLAVVHTRAEPLGIEVVEGDEALLAERLSAAAEAARNGATAAGADIFGVLLQSPDTSGRVHDLAGLCQLAHAAGALAVVATDLLALTLFTPPGEQGADVVIGNSQRFGVPLGYGGPHAAFMATREAFVRQLPGRLVGVTRDAHGEPALRLALQTREQHIRRERATSNICTAQVLLAIVAASYAVYHGPDGLRAIAERVHCLTGALARALSDLGCEVHTDDYFDTLRVVPRREPGAATVERARRDWGINLRDFGDGSVGIALDETVTPRDVADLVALFGGSDEPDVAAMAAAVPPPRAPLRRTSAYLSHPVFQTHRSETELLRYLHRLEAKDLSLTTSMIPLGSCTMKLNATAEMMPLSWPGFARIHPFAPPEQASGYHRLIRELDLRLREITGFAATSFQPNAGSQGEYAGLLVIRAYQRARGQSQRDVCLIPTSAHGTNPASAVLAGMRVAIVQCDANGNIDLADLRAKAAEHGDRLAALMVTYPSTHGVFEATIREICEVVHAHGGQVYLDGANLNALVGLVRPADFGADVCHLNLHKTFCIPHGGGGPGMGPICVAEHLKPYLPTHPVIPTGGAVEEEDPTTPQPAAVAPGVPDAAVALAMGALEAASPVQSGFAGAAVGAVSAAPWGSPLILTISYAYIALMGSAGLRRATEVAILNANYIARRLAPHYPVLYRGQNGLVAHECILDLRPLKAAAGIEAIDVAKRLMDYGFHAPTMSWPVAGTLMIEPTESEPKAELDRFCEAMIAIREEIRAVELGQADRDRNLLTGAPHTAAMVCADDWDRPYSRRQAAFPAPWQREHKYWPPVARVDDPYGDRHLVCACPPVEAYGS
jgi:glycine dehydrogenase